jgi:hypothetical protein
MSSQAIEGLPALGLIVGIGAVALVGVVLMIAQLCRQLAAQMRGESEWPHRNPPAPDYRPKAPTMKPPHPESVGYARLHGCRRESNAGAIAAVRTISRKRYAQRTLQGKS